MRKALLALILAGGASLALMAAAGEAAAGPAVPRDAVAAGDGGPTRVGYYHRHRRHCCAPRFRYKRRAHVYGYYAPPIYYPPPVVYYPPPVVYYPPPVVYGGYAPLAPYRPYAAYYGSYYDW
jgi:hypothetical protein